MKKVLSVILAIIMVALCMPLAFASDSDMIFNDLYWTYTKFDLYRYNIYYPIEETIEGYEEYEGYVFTDIGDLMDAKLEIALRVYPESELEEEYLEEHPERIAEINDILEGIIAEIKGKFASGEYTMVADQAFVAINMYELLFEIDDDTTEEFDGLPDTLPESTESILDEKYSIFNDMYNACSEDITAYTYEETQAAAEDFIAFLREVVECIKVEHKQIAYKNNDNGTHSMICEFCGFVDEAEQEHTFDYYTSTDYGLTINKCTACDETEIFIDDAVLNQTGKDVFVRECSKYLGYMISVYENPDDVYRYADYAEESCIKFSDRIITDFGSENNFDAEPTKDWIDQNIDNIPTAVLIFGYPNAMMEKSISDGETVVIVDSFEFTDALITLASNYNVQELDDFANDNPGIIEGIEDAWDALMDQLSEGELTNQQDFDEFVAPVIETCKKIADCLDGNHSGEYADLADGTHKLDCTFCSYVSNPEAHTWGDYTDNEDGTKTAKCTDCDATDTIAAELPDDSEDVDNEDGNADSESSFAEKLYQLILDFINLIKKLFEKLNVF